MKTVHDFILEEIAYHDTERDRLYAKLTGPDCQTYNLALIQSEYYKCCVIINYLGLRLKMLIDEQNAEKTKAEA
jgi:hypothetical protein